MSEGQKYDAGKPGGFNLIPPEARLAMAAVLTYGEKKYGAPSGWRTVPNAQRRYRDALDRHILAMDQGETTDAESGLPHLWHALTNMAFLTAFVSTGEEQGRYANIMGGGIHPSWKQIKPYSAKKTK